MSERLAASAGAEWPTARAGNVLTLVNGRAFKPVEWSTTGLPIFRIQNLNDPDAPFNYYGCDLPPKFRIERGDLLFAWSGTPGTSFGAHIWQGGPAWLNQHIFKVLFDDREFDKRFLCYAINRNLQEYIRLAHGGAGLAHITKGRFEDSLLLKPPIEDQRRIVEEIEQQLTRLDAGVSALKRVQANLKRYRATVLKTACEGRLVPTEAELARQEGRPYEPASALLAQIVRANADAAESSRQRSVPHDPAMAHSEGTKSLPEGWVATKVGECFRVVVGSTPSRKVRAYWGGDVPWVTSGEVQFNTVVDSRERISQSALAECSVELNPPGSVLIGMIGEGRTRGQVALLGIPACNNQNCAAIWVSATQVLPAWVFIWLRARYEQTRAVGSGNNQRALNKKLVAAIPLALPPLAEQLRIVKEVDRLLSLAECLSHEAATGATRGDRLRQSLLSTAFSGGSGEADLLFSSPQPRGSDG
jgi:type I restriction enzyme S subunit